MKISKFGRALGLAGLMAALSTGMGWAQSERETLGYIQQYCEGRFHSPASYIREEMLTDYRYAEGVLTIFIGDPDEKFGSSSEVFIEMAQLRSIDLYSFDGAPEAIHFYCTYGSDCIFVDGMLTGWGAGRSSATFSIRCDEQARVVTALNHLRDLAQGDRDLFDPAPR